MGIECAAQTPDGCGASGDLLEQLVAQGVDDRCHPLMQQRVIFLRLLPAIAELEREIQPCFAGGLTEFTEALNLFDQSLAYLRSIDVRLFAQDVFHRLGEVRVGRDDPKAVGHGLPVFDAR
ncbi:hypothetical protein D3C84_1086400 [compost metagenome]